MRKGFTLIELLIVVAIIAILAAIAVPNFLEAQVRAKVSRVKADQRSLATAIESYYVDNNNYPATDSSNEQAASGYGVNNVPGASQELLGLPTFRRKKDDIDGLSTLTTPISYISSYFPDPFAKTKQGKYIYSVANEFALGQEIGRSGWIVWSFGPDNDEVPFGQLQPGDIGLANYTLPAGMELTRVSESWYSPNAQVPSLNLITWGTYDPTNGSTSNGDVYRVKQ